MYPQMEHDACGIGSIVNIDGRQDRRVVDDALHIVEKLEHRAGKDATGEVGDGVGILTQIPHGFESPFVFPEIRDGFRRKVWHGTAQAARQAITESACFSCPRIT